MSTSLLYHAFGVRGYRYRRTDFIEGAVVFTIEQDRSAYCCPLCDSANVEARGKTEPRVFMNLPIGGKQSFIHFAIPKVKCQDCGAHQQVRVAFAAEKRRRTRAFERYVLELSQMTTIADAANHLGVSWHTVKEIQKEHLRKRYAKPRLKDVRQIAIDEIHVGKSGRYWTLVLDLETGAVVFVGEGKDAEALKPFWKRLRSSGAKVRAVASDMSKAYISAVRQALPKAAHVFDRFHVVKLFNEMLTKLRRKLHREASDELQQTVLKGIRWLLLKHPDNLDEERDEQQRLQRALTLNQPLATAYYLGEELREFWKQPSKRKARGFLNGWIRRAKASGIEHLKRFANTLTKHRAGLLAYYEYPITTGPLEGTNNKIKTIRRQAYGYRDDEFFKLKIFAAHSTRFALLGGVT